MHARLLHGAGAGADRLDHGGQYLIARLRNGERSLPVLLWFRQHDAAGGVMGQPRWAAMLLGMGLAMGARGEALTVMLPAMPGLAEPPAGGQEAHGVVVDIVREMGRRANINFRIVFYPQARSRLLAERQADACFPGAHLPELSDKYKWSAPVGQMRMVMLARDDDVRDVRGLEQAKALRVGAMRGTMVAARLKEMGLALDESADSQSGMEKLKLGRLDLWAMLDVGVASLAGRLAMPKPRVAWVIGTLDVSLACNLKVDDSLLARVDKAIAEMRADGSMGRFDLR
ncbi:hypothetical protein DK842_15610 [Chromobacterium phragmitis]|nr:hypothetical protein DK842_15610 [Chromobacterium phragmitis]